MDMSVDQTRAYDLPFQVDLGKALVASQAGNIAVPDRNVAFLELTRENVQYLRVLQDQIRFFFTPGSGYQLELDLKKGI